MPKKANPKNQPALDFSVQPEQPTEPATATSNRPQPKEPATTASSIKTAKSNKAAAPTVSMQSAQPGDIVYVEHAGDGTSRSVVAVDFHSLEKGAIFMTRGVEGTVWFMGTKFHGPSPERDPWIVFQYDGPYRPTAKTA